MIRSLRDHWGNPVSRHTRGRSLHRTIESCREHLLDWIRPAGDSGSLELVWTSGGSESINHVIQGSAMAARRFGNHLILSSVEHPSAHESIEFLQNSGFEVTVVRADTEGRITPDAIASAISDRTIMVFLQAVNQDLGTVQPVRETGMLLREHGIPLVVDAVYGCGWVDLKEIMAVADALALSFHRFFGPPSLGAVVFRSGHAIQPLIRGGIQESGLRAGMENYHSIAGLKAWLDVMASRHRQLLMAGSRHQTELLRTLRERVSGLFLNGPEPGPHRSAGNLNLSVAGVEGEGVVLRADLKRVRLGSGSACLGSRDEGGRVLAEIGAGKERILSSFSASPHPLLTAGELNHAAEVIVSCIEFLRSMNPDWDTISRDPRQLHRLMSFEKS